MQRSGRGTRCPVHTRSRQPPEPSITPPVYLERADPTSCSKRPATVLSLSCWTRSFSAWTMRRGIPPARCRRSRGERFAECWRPGVARPRPPRPGQGVLRALRLPGVTAASDDADAAFDRRQGLRDDGTGMTEEVLRRLGNVLNTTYKAKNADKRPDLLLNQATTPPHLSHTHTPT